MGVGLTANFLSACQLSDWHPSTYEESSRFPWRYYYVKYDSFRPGRYGKHGISDRKGRPYVTTVMWTASNYSENAYVPYLKEADPKHISRDTYGLRLSYRGKHIICENDTYLLRLNKNSEVLESFPINQDEDGIDTEDRVILLKEFIELIKSGGLGNKEDDTPNE